MRFSLDSDQQALIDAVATVLAAECIPSDLRAIAEGGEGRSASRWRVLAELGAMSLLAPESAGGLGLGEVEMTGLLEAAGRAVLPEPFAESAALALPLLLATGAPNNLIESVASGASVATVGGVDVSEHGPVLSATVSANRVVVPRVVGAGVARHYLLFVPDADTCALYSLESDSTTVVEHTSVDPTRTIGDVTFTPTDAPLVSGVDAARLLNEVASRGALAASAQLLGLASGAIEMSADYATARNQFGKPIGSFQAVKHLLANAKVRHDFARPALYRAADSLRRELPSRHRDVAIAKALASDAADLAARVSLQVHGAIGYTWECDLQFYLKRIWVLSAAWGCASAQRARVLADALDSIG